MVAANGRGGFDNLVGQQILVDGFSIFTLGNFNVRKTLNQREVRPYNLSGFLKPVSLRDATTEKLKFNFDYKDFTSFALYGSLKERIRGAVNNIIINFPAALFAYRNTANSLTITNLTTTQTTTTWEIPEESIYNPYGIYYRLNQTITSGIRNFVSEFSKYVVLVDEIEYEIIDVIIPSTNNDNLIITVSGLPNLTTATNYHILPKYLVRQEIYNSLGEFETYLLNQNTLPLYTATFRNTIDVDFGSGRKFIEETITWPSFDGYNPDLNSVEFNNYISSLLDIASRLDEIRSNFLVRMLISPNVVDNDNENFGFNKIIQIYGREFDNVKNYIETLSYMATISYDKKKNIPDQLIKRFATNLGFDVKSFYNESSLLNNLFNPEVQKATPEWGKNLSPIDFDNELWRRLVLNSSYLFKSKGTRKVLDFILKFIGAPDNLFEINEYVFVGKQKLEINNLTKIIPQLSVDEIFDALPIDNDGYPNVNKISQPFQSSGLDDFGLSYIRELTDLNLSIGDSDKIDGFTLEFVNDDRKIWKSTDTSRTYFTQTRRAHYLVKDERLVINTKNLNIFISGVKAIENDVYGKTLELSATTINNFYEFIKKTYQTGINPQNRKVSLYYPKLQKLWFDYVNEKYSNNKMPLTYSDINKYIKQIDGFWAELVNQFIPATAITTSGVKTSNTIFGQNKFAYKYGEDTSSLFKTHDGEFSRIKDGSYRTVKSSGSKLRLLNGETKNLLAFRNSYINLEFANDFRYQLATNFISDFRWKDNIYITLLKNNFLRLDFYENDFISSTSIFGQSNQREGSKNFTYFISGFRTNSNNLNPCNSEPIEECQDCIDIISDIEGTTVQVVKQECLLVSNFNLNQGLQQPILPRYNNIDSFIVNLASSFNGRIDLYNFNISNNSTVISGTISSTTINQSSLPGVRLVVQNNKYLLLTIDYNQLPIDVLNRIECSVIATFKCDETIINSRLQFPVRFITPTNQQPLFNQIIAPSVLETQIVSEELFNNNEVLTINVAV